jgi:hypothetical protein
MEATGGVGKVLNYLIVEPIEKRSPALMSLRLSQILHDRSGGRFDPHVQRLLRGLKPKLPLPHSQHMSDKEIDASVETLNRQGWNILPWRLDPADIAALRAFAFNTPAYAKSPSERIAIDPANIPHDYGRYSWRISDLVRVPVVQRLIADGALHRIAQDYVGCRPLLTSISLWLDPVYDQHFDAHVYHYDNDGPGFLKFFIYLNDVDVDTGAHSFIQGSHVRRKPGHLSRAQFYEREDLLAHYGPDSEVVFSAPAGIILAEDTAGFHKGTTPRRDYRLLLQLQYAILDIPNLEEFSPGVEQVHVEGLDPSIRRIGRKFFI